jgi:2-methylcitrate dehydratase
MSHKARQLVDYCRSITTIDDDVAREVGRRVLDSIGCAIGAWAEPIAAPLLAIGESALPGAGAGSQVFGRSTFGMLEWVAFCNAGFVRALDFNDTYLSREPAHPSDNIAPLLAVAQAYAADGASFARAVALAYEVQCRLCDATSLRRHGIDHVVFGNFSVAAAAGALMGLEADTITHALGIAGVGHIALRQTREGDMANWKAAAFGNAARNALFALRAAQHGLTGPNPIFEGHKGIESCLTGHFDLELPDAGTPPRKILDTCIKPFPVEYHALSAVEAAIELHERGIALDDVEAISIRTSAAACEIIGSAPEKWNPMSRETADHSLPYCVAVALRDGTVTRESFRLERFREPSMLAFLRRIEVVEDDGFTAAYGDTFSSHLHVRLKDGETVEAQGDYPLGHPRNPMSDEQIESKFRGLAEGLVRRADQDRIIAACRDLASLDAAALARLLPIIPHEPGTPREGR